MEKTLIILLSCIYLGTFIARNSIVKKKTNQRIKASDPLLTASIVSITLCLAVVILSTASETFYRYLGVFSFLRTPAVSYSGLSLFAVSIVMGWFISAQLKESWRVGVHENQKTALIQTGIYKFVRNPYFLSYFIMFTSLFLVRPSLVIGILIAVAIGIFHRMVLKEEAYLSAIHGRQYETYKASTGRYMPRFGKRDRD